VSERYVAFTVGTTRYCVPIAEVQRIVRRENVTEVPQAPGYVEGVMNLRGEIVPVIDMRQRLGVPSDDAPRKSRVIIAEVAGRLYGLHVDDVREIVEVEGESVATGNMDIINTNAEFVRGIARVGDQLLIVLNLQPLLAGSGTRG
jgi:purine-binding chemotaxis protein CheW